MRKVLEDLYYGEIRTHDREIDMDSELGKAVAMEGLDEAEGVDRA